MFAAAMVASACDDASTDDPPVSPPLEAATSDAPSVDVLVPPADGAPDTPAGPLDVTVTFEARVGAQLFDCSTKFAGLGTSKAEVSPNDFRFYVHDVALVRANDGAVVPVDLTQDGKWQSGNLALLDFENGAMGCATDGNPDTNAVVRGKVPAGSYRGLRFVVGVPFAKNHANQATAPSPLNLGKLFWSWNSGYLFAKIEATAVGMDDAGSPYAPFLVHVGSTGCVGDAQDGGVASCARPNRLPLAFDAYEIGKSKVVVDYAALVSGSDLTVNGGGPPGCMSFPGDPDCPAVFERLGLDYATGTPAATAGSAFRVE